MLYPAFARPVEALADTKAQERHGRRSRAFSRRTEKSTPSPLTKALGALDIHDRRNEANGDPAAGWLSVGPVG
ncbi:hypothetical protein J2D73_04370 [Acetobacter sacchari]|uniref:Uncharacterized protein n=1 Tax=Acetobacter sacchari TaxID=2661687 RepID=A0ABS3LSZ5_9PROT|nr:hypothetical protein [Acetobacter sacchari]MBO1359034.1 hypothetical protein [Acetobacter sacchari]